LPRASSPISGRVGYAAIPISPLSHGQAAAESTDVSYRSLIVSRFCYSRRQRVSHRGRYHSDTNSFRVGAKVVCTWTRECAGASSFGTGATNTQKGAQKKKKGHLPDWMLSTVEPPAAARSPLSLAHARLLAPAIGQRQVKRCRRVGLGHSTSGLNLS